MTFSSKICTLFYIYADFSFCEIGVYLRQPSVQPVDTRARHLEKNQNAQNSCSNILSGHNMSIFRLFLGFLTFLFLKPRNPPKTYNQMIQSDQTPRDISGKK
jgi:hypothetical protein